MIIVRVPFRLPLGGGGSDLPEYYRQYTGHLLTASINKFMYVSINEPATADKIKLYYKFAEQVSDVSEIKHNIIRESLKLFNINRPIEIGSMADIEAGTGMGSSSAFTVGLVAGLSVISRQFLSPERIADLACKIEIELVGKPIGKQDQYATALGGINELLIVHNGDVIVTPVHLDRETLTDLENHLMMFYTNTSRDANEILAEQSKSIVDKEQVTSAMHDIKFIGAEIKNAIQAGNISEFGKLLNHHWEVKKTISQKMSSSKIDAWYKTALNNGAVGGKIMGAGGGGFLLLCAAEGRRKELKTVMEVAGLKYMDFRFEFEGVKILTNVH